VLIHARLAASVVNATRMDRPEWIVVSKPRSSVMLITRDDGGIVGARIAGKPARAQSPPPQTIRVALP
jgi:secreted PhoX family phosphatase